MAPVKPKGISRAASRVWDELVPEMASAAVLRPVDQRALWHLCEDEALVREAYAGIWRMVRALKEKAKKEGKDLPAGPLMSLLSMPSGRMAMSAIRDLGVRAIVQRREFGLTPSSRSRVEALEAAVRGGGGTGNADPLRMKLCANKLPA